MVWPNLLLIGTSCWIGVDDFRTRTIHVVAPLVLIVLSVIAGVLQNQLLWQEWLLNAGLMAVILTLVLGYAAIRFGKGRVFQQLGLGDVILLLAFPVLLPTYWMLYCLIAGAAMGILGMFVFHSFRERGAPLAGIYGFLLAGYFSWQLIL